MTQSAPKFDALKPGEYSQYLYKASATVPLLNDLQSVDDEALTRYHEDGYLAIANAFTPEEVDEMKNALHDLVMGKYPDFEHLEFEWHAKDKLSQLSHEQRQDVVRKLMYFCNIEPRLHAIAFAPKVILTAEKILHASVNMFQDMALFKSPLIGREKPWHQDHAYFNLLEGTPVVGFWIALDEATLENGCMHFLKGGHKQGIVPHFQRRDWQICDTEMEHKDCVAAPLPPGGCLIFNGLTPHGTPHNTSPLRRRALQFHYCPSNAQRISTEERMQLFGSEGRDVSC